MLARFVWGALTAGAMVAPALAGQMNADEARKFVSGKVFAFTCFDGTRGAGRLLDDGGAAGAVQFNGSGPVRHIRLPGNTNSSPWSGRLRVDQGHSIRAVLQPRQERRTQLPRLGLGHGLCLLRFPSPGCGADDDGAGGSPAAFAETAGADRSDCSGADRAARGDGAGRDPVGRERENRAGQIRGEIRASEIGKCVGAAPHHRLTVFPVSLSWQRLRRPTRPACGTGSAGTASRSPPAPSLNT